MPSRCSKAERAPLRRQPMNASTHCKKIAYLSVMLVLTPVILFTGILFSDIVYFFNFINYIGGVRILDALHVATGYAFLLLFNCSPLHVYLRVSNYLSYKSNDYRVW